MSKTTDPEADAIPRRWEAEYQAELRERNQKAEKEDLAAQFLNDAEDIKNILKPKNQNT